MSSYSIYTLICILYLPFSRRHGHGARLPDDADAHTHTLYGQHPRRTTGAVTDG